MKHLTATFLRGLITILPIVLTIYLFWWMGSVIENMIGRPLKALLPDVSFVPGMAIAIAVLIVFAVGLVMELYLVRKVLGWLEQQVLRVPLVKQVYGALRDFAGFMSTPGSEQAMGQVVRVEVAPGMHLIGFVTRADLAALPSIAPQPDSIAVYLPMSYQIGGYTLLLPRSKVQPVDVSVEEALRFTLTAGVTGPAGDSRAKKA